MEKMQKKFNNLEALKDYVSKNLTADEHISILFSNETYYLEDSPAFVRAWETLIYEGEVSSMNI